MKAHLFYTCIRKVRILEGAFLITSQLNTKFEIFTEVLLKIHVV
jgi:hypothetical protein